eukprot:2988778-Rhodomonas_salina.2
MLPGCDAGKRRRGGGSRRRRREVRGGSDELGGRLAGSRSNHSTGYGHAGSARCQESLKRREKRGRGFEAGRVDLDQGVSKFVKGQHALSVCDRARGVGGKTVVILPVQKFGVPVPLGSVDSFSESLVSKGRGVIKRKRLEAERRNGCGARGTYPQPAQPAAGVVLADLWL